MTMCIHGCGNTVSPQSRLNECKTCRHALYYWRKKRPAQIIQRRMNLNIYGSRLDEHFNTVGKEAEKHARGNVVTIRSRKRA